MDNCLPISSLVEITWVALLESVPAVAAALLALKVAMPSVTGTSGTPVTLMIPIKYRSLAPALPIMLSVILPQCNKVILNKKN